MMKKLLFYFMLTFGMTALAYGQTKVITGKVTTVNAEPIPGASVRLKGTNASGTQTNANGIYQITVPQSTAELVFSSISYQTKEVKLSGSTLNVVLEEDETGLSEVIVVGYGTSIKRDITGAVAQVKGDELENIPVTSFESALQGKASGVMISSQNGKLGQGITVRVRGAASVTAGTEPLYIVDGIPITTTDLSSTSAPTSPLADLNANDIESIEILKDAASSAIYGARASNGVVLITTKQGKAGKTAISFNVLGGIIFAFQPQTISKCRTICDANAQGCPWWCKTGLYR